MGACPGKEAQEAIQNGKIPQSMQSARSSKFNVHELDEIMKKADNPNIRDDATIRSGIFLDQKKKKFWVEENGNNCFMLFARDLDMEYGSVGTLWRWFSEIETIGTKVEVAELTAGCWSFDIRAKFDVSLLTPRITYQIFFIIKLKKSSNCQSLESKLFLPDGTVQEWFHEMLDKKPKEEWIKSKALEFEIQTEKRVELMIYLRFSRARGVVIKGIMIRPKIFY